MKRMQDGLCIWMASESKLLQLNQIKTEVLSSGRVSSHYQSMSGMRGMLSFVIAIFTLSLYANIDFPVLY